MKNGWIRADNFDITQYRDLPAEMLGKRQESFLEEWIEDWSGHTYENPAYTGDHIDGFGNKMTVRAVANPHNMHKQPEILHNRAVGYGLVTFNKKERTIKTDCFQRFKDPLQRDAQYPGWPQTVSQLDNFSKKADAWLPELQIACEVLPVLKLYDENGMLVYAIRLRYKIHRPRVFAKGNYTIELSVPEWGYSKIFKNLEPENPQKKKLAVKIERGS